MPYPPERLGYVVKVYPRFSETFVVNEILAHERQGAELEIFSLRPPTSGRFHETLGGVRAQTHYLPSDRLKAETLWTDLHASGGELPGLWREVRQAPNEDVRNVHQAAVLAREALRRGVTHLHSHFASVAAGVTRLAARMAGLPYSVTAHAKDIFHEEVDSDALRRRLLDASVVVTVSDFNAAHLRQVCPEAADRISRVYNGIDLDLFRFCPPDERSRRIVAVGRLVEKKGFAVLVESCALLQARGAEFQCDIVGDGPLEHELRSLIAQHRLGERVRLLGARTQQEVRELIRGAAALAAPCVVGTDGNRDGLPTVLLEAMALGTPCVSTDLTGIPEVIRPEKTGLLVRQANSAELAFALARLLDDPALGRRLAHGARTLIEDEFDVDRNAAKIRSLFTAARRLTDVRVPGPRGHGDAADAVIDGSDPAAASEASDRSSAAPALPNG